MRTALEDANDQALVDESPELPGREALSALPTERLEAALVGAAAVEAAAKARFLVFLGEFVDRRGWEPWQCVSPVQWLSWQCGLGTVAASEHVRAATALRELPALTAALAAGAVTWSKIRAVTRVATPATEAQWLHLARAGTAAHVERIVRAYRRVSAEQVDRAHELRSLTWRQEDNGAVVFQLRVPPATGAALVAAIEQRAVPVKDVPIAATRADALAHLVLGEADEGTAAPAVMILTTPQALAGGPGPCATGQGIAVDTETAAMAACSGAVVTPDQDGTTEPGHRLHRYPTTRTRRHLIARDPTCRFPGCHHTGRLDAHHLVHWIHGGPRCADNLILLCAAHHRLTHRHRLELRLRSDGTLAAFRPDGTALHLPVGASPQPRPTPTTTPLPWWAGERLDLDHILTGLLPTIGQHPPDGPGAGSLVGSGAMWQRLQT